MGAIFKTIWMCENLSLALTGFEIMIPACCEAGNNMRHFRLIHRGHLWLIDTTDGIPSDGVVASAGFTWSVNT